MKPILAVSLRMKSTCGACLSGAVASALFALAPASMAGILTTVDTPVTFQGTFSVENIESLVFTPVVFASFPTSEEFGASLFNGFRDGQLAYTVVIFPSFLADPITEPLNVGVSDEPGTITTFPNWSGQFKNGGVSANQIVDWNLTNLRDTGGPEGLFTGNFSFTIVPEPSVTALMVAALLGSAAWRRHSGRKQATDA
jgi:hypothetical protein